MRKRGRHSQLSARGPPPRAQRSRAASPSQGKAFRPHRSRPSAMSCSYEDCMIHCVTVALHLLRFCWGASSEFDLALVEVFRELSPLGLGDGPVLIGRAGLAGAVEECLVVADDVLVEDGDITARSITRTVAGEYFFP